MFTRYQYQPLHLLNLLLLFCCVYTSVSYAIEPQISAGRYHNLAVNSQGDVYWWGQYQAANYRLGSEEKAIAPAQILGLSKIKAVATGMDHSLALAEDGGIFEWGFSPYVMQDFLAKNNSQTFCKLAMQGWNDKGINPCEKALYSKTRIQEPIRIRNIPPAIAIAGSDNQSLMISSTGDVYCWNGRTAPKKIAGLSHIKAIAMGQFHGVALSANGDVFTWGGNVNGELGYATSNLAKDDFTCGTATPKVAFRNALAISAGVNDSYALLADGSIWGAGREPDRWLSDPNKAFLEPRYPTNVHQFRKIITIENTSEIAGGAQHMIAKTRTGEVYAWGFNGVGDGVLGSGTSKIESTLSPIKVLNLKDVMIVSTTWDHTLAISKEGYVCAWGQNYYGTVRPDSQRRGILSPSPVLLSDATTPLNLYQSLALTKSLPEVVCGDSQWRNRMTLDDVAEEKVKTDAQRERSLVKKLGLNLRVPYYSTALIEAARSNNKAAVKSLLASCKEDINSAERYGKTALQLAQEAGYAEVVALLQAVSGCNKL
ncbi:MAG: ankyrin repeat domain-containing protein [Methylophilaceae bacterium]